MKVAFVSGPYRAPSIRETVLNIRRAEKVAVSLWRLGYAVICPHLNTALFDGVASDEVWLKGDLEIMRRCDLVVMIEGWRESRGAIAEGRLAIELGIPVYEWTLHQRELREGA